MRLLRVRRQSIERVCCVSVERTLRAAIVCPWTEPCRSYCVSVDRALKEATACPWTEHCRGYCVYVDRALSRLMCVYGQSIVEATVYLWTQT